MAIAVIISLYFGIAGILDLIRRLFLFYTDISDYIAYKMK